MKNKNEGNDYKIIPGDFNCTMDKMDRDGGKKKKKKKRRKTQRAYRCCSIYALSKLIVDNGLEVYEERRTQIPLSSPATIRPLARIQERQGLY